MKKTLLLLAAGTLAGASIVYFVARPTKPADPEADAELLPAITEQVAAPATAESAHTGRREATRLEAKTALAPAKATHVSAWDRLAEKYGPEKTALSAKITSNLTTVIDQGMNLADTWAKNSGSSTFAEAATKEILRNATTQLALSDTQQEQASAVIQNLIGRRMGAVTELTSAMRTEPEQIMDMLLAGDALALGKITQEQYDELTRPTRAMLQNVAGFVMGQQPGATGIAQLVGDELTANQLKAILTPEQQAKLTEIAATMNERIQARRARNSTNPRFSLQDGNIPVIELDKLDQSIVSVQKMTEAARLMMEGMKGLKDANPKLGTP